MSAEPPSSAPPPRAWNPGPAPRPPRPEQCCGTACDPCIWTYHQRALARWETRHAAWLASCAAAGAPDPAPASESESESSTGAPAAESSTGAPASPRPGQGPDPASPDVPER